MLYSANRMWINKPLLAQFSSVLTPRPHRPLRPQLISYDPHRTLLPIVCEFAEQPLQYGRGTALAYDFAAIQAALSHDLLAGVGGRGGGRLVSIFEWDRVRLVERHREGKDQTMHRTGTTRTHLHINGDVRLFGLWYLCCGVHWVLSNASLLEVAAQDHFSFL